MTDRMIPETSIIENTGLFFFFFKELICSMRIVRKYRMKETDYYAKAKVFRIGL